MNRDIGDVPYPEKRSSGKHRISKFTKKRLKRARQNKRFRVIMDGTEQQQIEDQKRDRDDS